MSRFLVTTWDGGGNVPPVLRIAQELRDRGHEVRVLGHAEQERRFASAGLDFTAYAHAMPFSRVAASDDPLLFFRVFTDGGPGRDTAALLDAWPADVLVGDCLMFGTLQAAQARGVPTAAVFHSLWAAFGEMLPHSPATELGEPVGRAPRQVWEAATEILVAADRELDPVQLAVPQHVHWVGVAQPAVRPAARSDRSRVLVSLSTVNFPGQQESLQRVLDALDGMPVRAVVTADASVDHAALHVPANVELRGVCDHLELMPEMALLVGHGGHATTMLALAHGLPVVVLPQHPMTDQPLLGHVVAAHGAGAVLEQVPEVEELRAAIVRLLQDDGAAARAAELGERLRGQDGARAAADRVEGLVRRPAVA
jgi:UDP:flavonoid glycosyltransferase YjiC (YdhE family)